MKSRVKVGTLPYFFSLLEILCKIWYYYSDVAKATRNNGGIVGKEERISMSIFYIKNGEKEKIRHHCDVRMPQGVSLTIPEEMTGCQEQHFEGAKLKPVIRFYTRPNIEVNADKHQLRVWYAASAKDFFKVSIRLTEPYIYNIKSIGEKLACTFLRLPKGFARGTNLEDIPGNILYKNVIGMEEYNPIPSRRTYETLELIGPEKDRRKQKFFDYWVFDQEMLNKGLLLTVGNENGVEFVRYHVIASLPENGKIMTAYVRPWFCEEYDI